MEIISIPIPGESTFKTTAPTVTVIGDVDEVICLKLTYRFSPSSDLQTTYELGAVRTGEIEFRSVMEYRFQCADHQYDDFQTIVELEERYTGMFGLDEIIGSPHITNMISGSRYGVMLAANRKPIAKSGVRHFRIRFDKYGRFDILARSVTMREFAR